MGSGGNGSSLPSDNLGSVGVLTEDGFRQLVVAVETTPACLGGLGELEDHGEGGLVGERSMLLECTVRWRTPTMPYPPCHITSPMALAA